MSGNVTLHVGRKRAQVTSTPERPTKAIKLETPEKPSGKHTPESIALTDEQPYYEQTVSFSRDSTNLSPAKRTILKHIKDSYVVPKDFTTNKLRYGPLAGQTMEERLLVNYEAGTLPLRHAKGKRVILCMECAGDGHKAKDCPSVFA